MKYCYPDDRVKRKCKCGGQEHICFSCRKVISDCEWVVNWGSCSECFSQPRKVENGSSKTTSA